MEFQAVWLGVGRMWGWNLYGLTVGTTPQTVWRKNPTPIRRTSNPKRLRSLAVIYDKLTGSVAVEKLVWGQTLKAVN